MRYALSRSDYEALLALSAVAMGLAPMERQALLDDQYPKDTAAAVAELRARGLQADGDALAALIDEDLIPDPEHTFGGLRWTREIIDEAAELLDRQGQYEPHTLAFSLLNIQLAADIRELHEAFDANPELPRSADYFVMEVLPGVPGLGVYARVRYRRQSREEEAELRALAAEAQRRRKKA